MALRPGHFGAADSLLDHFDERIVVRRPPQLGLRQHRSEATLAFRAVAPAAVRLKKFFAAREIRAAVGKLDARFGSRGNPGDQQDNRQGRFMGYILSHCLAKGSGVGAGPMPG